MSNDPTSADEEKFPERPLGQNYDPLEFGLQAAFGGEIVQSRERDSSPDKKIGRIIADRYRLIEKMARGEWGRSGWLSSSNRSKDWWPSN
ncbi:MAG: hypothetical protein KF851_17830 [Pirellulaceae bacterium]|nr:hypothetical protein [Pirellulaceae bacterium]